MHAERDFYVSLGFEVTYEGPEYPNFVAVGTGAIEFGLERRDTFDRAAPDEVLVWQFQVPDVDAAAALLSAAGHPFDEEWMTPREDWKYRVLHARTPNGYHLLIEGLNEA